MADPITADSNPTPPQTAGEGGLDPMVPGYSNDYIFANHNQS